MNPSHDQPQISVIVPIWQPWEATEKLWKSLERQSVAFELITIDGSRGAPRARNRGAEVALGDFILFCDQDIELHPLYLSSLFTALQANPHAGYAYCDYRRCGALDGLWRSRPFDAAALRQRNFISTCSLLRRRFFPSFDEALERYQDWDLWLTILERGIHGTYVPRALFTAHYRPGDISTNAATESLWHQRVWDKHTARTCAEAARHPGA